MAVKIGAMDIACECLSYVVKGQNWATMPWYTLPQKVQGQHVTDDLLATQAEHWSKLIASSRKPVCPCGRMWQRMHQVYQPQRQPAVRFLVQEQHVILETPRLPPVQYLCPREWRMNLALVHSLISITLKMYAVQASALGEPVHTSCLGLA